MVTCPECSENVQYCNLKDHPCKEKSKCEGCQVEIPKQDLQDNHKQIDCPFNCGASVYKCKINSHLQENLFAHLNQLQERLTKEKTRRKELEEKFDRLEKPIIGSKRKISTPEIDEELIVSSPPPPKKSKLESPKSLQPKLPQPKLHKLPLAIARRAPLKMNSPATQIPQSISPQEPRIVHILSKGSLGETPFLIFVKMDDGKDGRIIIYDATLANCMNKLLHVGCIYNVSSANITNRKGEVDIMLTTSSLVVANMEMMC